MADALAPPAGGGGVPPPPPSTDDGPSLAGLQPIPTKKTLMVINSFIINTVDFLNKFNAVSEQKLLQVQQAIQRVEITLALLEGKLESVPWLSQLHNPTSQPPPSNPHHQPLLCRALLPSSHSPVASWLSVPLSDGDLPPPSTASTNDAIPIAPPPTSDVSAPPPMDAPPAAPPRPQLKDDDRYKRFFKMMGMGVPPHVLKLKVESEGLDPAVLDMDPEGPAPDGWERAHAPSQDDSASDSDSGSDSD